MAGSSFTFTRSLRVGGGLCGHSFEHTPKSVLGVRIDAHFTLQGLGAVVKAAAIIAQFITLREFPNRLLAVIDLTYRKTG